jgi:choline dehydrogenase-like flavoprotein
MRVYDLNELEDISPICIVGGGPTGLSIANEFAGTNSNVLVLEGGGLAIGRLAEDKLFRAETRSKSPVVRKPLPQDDPKQRQPDITLGKRHLGWPPNLSMKDGLKPTAAYFRSLIVDTCIGLRVRSLAAE